MSINPYTYAVHHRGALGVYAPLPLMPHGLVCPPLVLPCLTHAGWLSTCRVGATPPRHTNRGSRATHERYAPPLSLALSPNDLHRTGSTEPCTPLSPCPHLCPNRPCVTGSMHCVSPPLCPTHVSRTCELGGLHQEGQGVTAMWEMWQALPSAPTLTCDWGAPKAGVPQKWGP